MVRARAADQVAWIDIEKGGSDRDLFPMLESSLCPWSSFPGGYWISCFSSVFHQDLLESSPMLFVVLLLAALRSD